MTETETVTRTAPAEESAEPTEDTSSDGSSASPEAPQQEETENLTSRGNIPKQVGEEARLIAPSGQDARTFTVTGLEPDYTCTAVRAAGSADTADSEETYFVRLDITASGGSAEEQAAAVVRTAHGDAGAMDPSLVGEAVDTLLNNMRIHAATSKI